MLARHLPHSGVEVSICNYVYCILWLYLLSCFSIKSDYAKTEICKRRQRDFQFGDWLQIWYFGQHNFASIISSNRIAISESLLIWYGSNLEFKYVYQFSICMSADQIFQWNDATPSSILMKIFWVNIFDECEHTSYSSTIKTKITKCFFFFFLAMTRLLSAYLTLSEGLTSKA